MCFMPRPCERKCQGRCGQWKHHSRFDSWEDKRLPLRNGTVPVSFSPKCRDCEQKERNEKKNQDRPLAIIRQRTTVAARKANMPFEFFWKQMNYEALVEPFRVALITKCRSCGHMPKSEADVQIEHIEPPRDAQDWARLHARNIHFLCGSCNRTKSDKSYAQWLDEQEGARLSNLANPDLSDSPLVKWNRDMLGMSEIKEPVLVEDEDQSQPFRLEWRE